MTEQPPKNAAKVVTVVSHVRLVWVDADAPPIFQWTRDPVDGFEVFRTFSEAKKAALARFRHARRRIADAIASTQAMTREDVEAP